MMIDKNKFLFVLGQFERQLVEEVVRVGEAQVGECHHTAEHASLSHALETVRYRVGGACKRTCRYYVKVVIDPSSVRDQCVVQTKH